ncbi:MAG TPA: triose-phosphate isomerase [Synergistaceae bacterium]|nr:triose-phosphate isomerase [Synergistaceae bacterium]HQF91813.1 triose-phosphate isomerase [Synergistaceae bacterium]HQK25228.1 triose-phosphate isomerase [Synergistaceae bacterium]
MRKILCAGNWKMNLAPAAAKAFGEELRTVLMGEEGAGRRVRAGQIELALMPPFVSIAPVRQALEGMPVTLGAQNCHEEPQGAFTGEIGAPMLAEMGCHYVIIGHSERRHIFGETDELVMKKIKAVKDSGMVPILCVGELLEEREGNRTLAVLERQIRAVLPQMAPEDVRDHFVVAYEPVWAIGTGKVASEDDAQEACRFIRELAATCCGAEAAEALRILYGGSVKPENAAGLVAQQDVDGFLVGGASIKVASLMGIVAASVKK